MKDQYGNHPATITSCPFSPNSTSPPVIFLSSTEACAWASLDSPQAPDTVASAQPSALCHSTRQPPLRYLRGTPLGLGIFQRFGTDVSLGVSRHAELEVAQRREACAPNRVCRLQHDHVELFIEIFFLRSFDRPAASAPPCTAVGRRAQVELHLLEVGTSTSCNVEHADVRRRATQTGYEIVLQAQVRERIRCDGSAVPTDSHAPPFLLFSLDLLVSSSSNTSSAESAPPAAVHLRRRKVPQRRNAFDLAIKLGKARSKLLTGRNAERVPARDFAQAPAEVERRAFFFLSTGQVVHARHPEPRLVRLARVARGPHVRRFPSLGGFTICFPLSRWPCCPRRR